MAENSARLCWAQVCQIATRWRCSQSEGCPVSRITRTLCPAALVPPTCRVRKPLTSLLGGGGSKSLLQWVPESSDSSRIIRWVCGPCQPPCCPRPPAGSPGLKGSRLVPLPPSGILLQPLQTQVRTTQLEPGDPQNLENSGFKLPEGQLTVLWPLEKDLALQEIVTMLASLLAHK